MDEDNKALGREIALQLLLGALFDAHGQSTHPKTRSEWLKTFEQTLDAELAKPMDIDTRKNVTEIVEGARKFIRQTLARKEQPDD